MSLTAAEVIRVVSGLTCRDRNLAAFVRGEALGGATIRIVRREDLIALKERAAADPRRRRSRMLRDQLDIEMLRGDVPDPDEGW
jgi:hypothetical protein